METLLRSRGIPPDHPGAAALKGLLDNGIPLDDERCQTLVKLLSGGAVTAAAAARDSLAVRSGSGPGVHDQQAEASAALALSRFSGAKDVPLSQPHAPHLLQMQHQHQPAAAAAHPPFGVDPRIAAASRYQQMRAAQSNTQPMQQNAQLARLPGLGLGLSHKAPLGVQYGYTPQQHVAPQGGVHGTPMQLSEAAQVTRQLDVSPAQPSLHQPQPDHNRGAPRGGGGGDTNNTDAHRQAQVAHCLRLADDALGLTETTVQAARQSMPAPAARNLFQPSPPSWPSNGKPDTGVPYLAPQGAAQLNFPVQTSNVYGAYANHLVGQPTLPHSSNRQYSFDDAQRAVITRRLMLEEQAARQYVPPQNASSQAVEMRQQPQDPVQFFAHMYSSPSQPSTTTPSSLPARSPASADRQVPATGAKPPPMPTTLRSIANTTPPKRKRTSHAGPVDTEVLDQGNGNSFIPPSGQTAPSRSIPPLPLSKPDPRAALDQTHPSSAPESKKRERRKSSKSAHKSHAQSSEDDPSETAKIDSADDDTHPSSEGSTTKVTDPTTTAKPANGVANGSTNHLDRIDAQHVFHVAKAMNTELQKTKRKRKRPKKTGENGRPVVDNLEQRVGGVKAKQVFQIKAQVDALRKVSRGMEPPTEVSVASGGAQPISKLVSTGLVLPSDMLSNGTYSKDGRGSARSLIKPSASASEIRKQQRPAPVPRLKPPQPVQYLPFRRNERIYSYRRESLENFARCRGILPSAVDPKNISRKPRTSAEPVLPDLAQLNEPKALPNGEPTAPSLEQPDSSSSHPLGVAKPTIAKTNPAAPITIAGPQYNARHFRELLWERERRIGMRIQNRIHEIASLPDDMPEDVRRRVIIEKKKLGLLKLQRSARDQVTGVMRSVFARGNSVLVGDQSLRMFRRQTPATWYWQNPNASAVGLTPAGDTLSSAARRQVQIMEQRHRAEQEARRINRQRATMGKLMEHSAKIQEFKSKKQALFKKLFRDLERYFRDRARDEERRKRKEQQDRLKALRENDEDAYMKLLKNTKNKRLLQLIKQTDEYLSQIGAKVEQQKQLARNAAEAKGENLQVETVREERDNAVAGSNGDDDDDLVAMRKRRNEYYTVTHTLKEKVYQPKTLVGGKLKPYQIEGLEWLVSLYNNNLNGILADEMGLGKTIQTLSLITYLVEVKQCHGPFLVIVPLSTVSNWVRELNTWAPSLTKIVYRGDPNTRRGIYNRQMIGGGYNVLLTTYEFIVKDTKVLGKVNWAYIIIDEGHRMKNSECKLAITLGSKYRSKNRVLLTGTPLQNNLTELWALLNFLLPTIFSNSETFEQWFNSPFQAACLGGNQSLDEEENLLVISRLHQVLRPFMLRRLKTDVECQLPDKVEEVLKCEMSAWQRIMYRQMRDRLGIAAGGSKTTTRAFNNIVMQLKKVANHPYLFYTEEELNSLPRDYLIRTSGKFELLSHVLRKLQATNHRTLIFSQMTSALDFLEMFMVNIGMEYLRLDGTTKADDRQKMLEDFNAKDSPYFCFLLSTRAGGLGLNLQTADTVIIFDSDWNPMMDLQAQDRAHRIGQTKEVRVLRLICAGTIEVQILERANQKLRMDAQVIQAGQFNNKSTDGDRTQMLKEILRGRDEGDELTKTEATSLETINRSLARSDEELLLFEQMDVDRLREAEEAGRPSLMSDEKEVPEWVLQPEVEKKSKEQLEAEYIEQHGRGQRKRKQISYIDNLTEQEFVHVVEHDGDLEGAVRRKRRRIAEESDDEDDNAEAGDDGGYSPPKADEEEESGKRKRPRGRPRKTAR